MFAACFLTPFVYESTQAKLMLKTLYKGSSLKKLVEKLTYNGGLENLLLSSPVIKILFVTHNNCRYSLL